ncbi:DNA-binding NarL/FixJ family response regulator [Roseovarius sp. MBR-154]|jgi:DNA-binding NarL/FixJ family response regulator
MKLGSELRPRRRVTSVLIVDDHPLYCDALASAISVVFPDCVVEQTASLKDALSRLETGFLPDLVMFDLKLPDVSGISGFITMRDRMQGVPILVISALSSAELVRTLMEEGAAGFLPKETSAQELRRVIARVGAGGTYLPKAYAERIARDSGAPRAAPAHPSLAALTPQQQKIMKLICAGKANKQIAYELSLAEATVKAHITGLLNRLGVKNRTQAAVLIKGAVTGGADDPETRAFLSG